MDRVDLMLEYLSLNHTQETGESVSYDLSHIAFERNVDLTTNEKVDTESAKSIVLYLNCTFVVAPKVKQFKPTAIANCSYVCSQMPTDAPVLPRFRLTKNYTFTDPFVCLSDTNASNVNWAIYMHNKQLDALEAQLEVLRELVSVSHHVLRYQDKLWRFSLSSFVGGVELEVPVRFTQMGNYKGKWYRDLDASQVCGNLEVTTPPRNLQYFLTKHWVKSVSSLYRHLSPPTNINLWGEAEGTKGSGIHLHVSWHMARKINAEKLREHYYKEIADRGGEKFLIDVGGKSERQLRYYSRYCLPSDKSTKYNFCAVKEPNHLELRWMNNNPSPEVVQQRVHIAVDTFKAAVVRYMSKELISFICKTNQPKLLLLK